MNKSDQRPASLLHTNIYHINCLAGAIIVAAATLIGAAFAGLEADNGPQSGLADKLKPDSDARGVVHRINMRVTQLHAGADAAEVERVLSRPTAIFEGLGTNNLVLDYEDEPIPASVTLAAGHVTAIALDLFHINTGLLPAHARMVKPTMVRAGVLMLLGKPDADERWVASGIEIEQLLYTRSGEAGFGVFLADGLVVDVKPGAERPIDIEHVTLPVAIPDDSWGTELSIGLNPEQAASLLGAAALMPITSTLKGQPTRYATHHERNGDRFVSLTFTGGTLTTFFIWSPHPTQGCGDTCLSTDR